jgi:hypothetical protein
MRRRNVRSPPKTLDEKLLMVTRTVAKGVALIAIPKASRRKRVTKGIAYVE